METREQLIKRKIEEAEAKLVKLEQTYNDLTAAAKPLERKILRIRARIKRLSNKLKDT